MAKQDLETLGETQVAVDALNRLRTRFCGIGQQRFHDDVFSIFDAPFSDFQRLLSLSSLNDWNDTALHAAAAIGNLEKIQFLLDNSQSFRVDINSRNRDDETPLLYAARSGRAQIVSLLIGHGADASLLSRRHESPLHYLTSFDDEDIPAIASLLVSKGSHLESVAEDISFGNLVEVEPAHATPLHLAVARNNPIAVMSLVQLGADVHMALLEHEVPSPLALAASFHYPESLEIMINHCKEINSTGDITIDKSTGRSLLLYAIRGGGSGELSSVFDKIARHGRLWKKNGTETLKILFDAGATNHFDRLPGMPHCTAVFYAIRGDRHIVDAILQRDKQALNSLSRVLDTDEPRLPLFEAILYHRFEVFDVLVKNGVDLTARLEYEGDTVTGLYYCAFSRHDQTEIAAAILNAGVGVDEGPDGVETPFICAVRSRAFRLARFLLKHRANPNLFFERGLFYIRVVPKTLLGSLLEETSPAMLCCLNFLLDNVKNLQITTTSADDWTVFHDIAALDLWVTKDDRDPTLGEVLRRLGSYFKPTPEQLNIVAENSVTALHLAADFGCFEVARWLVTNGADTSVLNQFGLTALDTAYIRRALPDDDVLDIPMADWKQKKIAEKIRQAVYD